MRHPPTLTEIIRGALNEGLERTKLAEEAAASAADGKGTPPEERKGTPPKKEDPAEKEKKKDGETKGPPTEVAEKVASALDYIINNSADVDWDKVASEMTAAGGAQTAGPAMGPGTLPIHETSAAGSAPGTNQGQAKQQLPMNPGMDSSAPGSKRTLMANDLNDAAGAGSVLANLQEGVSDTASGKEVQATLRFSRILGSRVKTAEDNGASFSAGPAAPFSGEETGENVPGVPPVAGAARAMVSSNQAAIDATKRDAQHKVNLGPVAGLLHEDAQRKAGDSTLHQALDNTNAAGAKIASLQRAAFRTYLAKCASIAMDPSADPEERAKAQKVVSRAEAVHQMRGGL